VVASIMITYATGCYGNLASVTHSLSFCELPLS
jgi:hypothetical protein